MVSANEIITFVDRLSARFTPQRVVLFGSYARGKPDNDSDVDLLITRGRWSMSPLTAAGHMRLELGVPFAMDLIVRSQGDLERGDSFAAEILEKGITLYAADDARVGSQGRVRLRRRLRSPAVAQEIEMR